MKGLNKMADIEKNAPEMEEENGNDEIEEILEDDTEIYTLEDEDGVETSFALLGTLEHEGNVYKAFVPVDEDGKEESNEYIILKCVEEDGEDVLISIDDDEEFDRIADIFDDEFSDILYDED